MSGTGDALNRYLSTVRRIEEHREQSAVKDLKKVYRQLMKEIGERVAESYARYADPETGAIDYAVLHRDGMDARLLEEIMRSTGIASLEECRIIEQLAKESYAKCYDGMVSAVQRAATDDALQESLQTIRAVAPEVVAEAVHNPVNGLTLADRLEKKRGEIIYGIKQSVGVGLSQGDRYDTMTRRIAETLAGADGAGGYYGKAVRIARTEAHRVREAGNNDAAAMLQEKAAPAGYQMLKRWNTMKDERVRPNRRYKTKKGWKSGKPGFYNHAAMDGVEIPLDEDFKLPSGASGPAPGQTNVAGEDINCRCFLTYRMEKRRGPRFRMNLQLHELKIPDQKLLGYALNPERDKNKAKAFLLALGYTQANYEELKAKILEKANRDSFRERGDAGFGMRYNQVIEISGANGKTAKVMTAWIQDGDDYRLTSVYVTNRS